MRLCEPTCARTGRSCWNLPRRPWPAPSTTEPGRRAPASPWAVGWKEAVSAARFWQQKGSTSTREGLDSRPPKTRKFHAGAKIVAGLPGRAPSSHARQAQPSMHHTPCYPRGLRHRAALMLPLSEPEGKGDPSPTGYLNAGTRLAVHLNRGVRNRKLMLVTAGQEPD